MLEMAARRAIGSEVGIPAKQELDRDQFPIQDTDEIETQESNSQLDELMALRREFSAFSDNLLNLENTSDCHDSNLRGWLTRECCPTHELAMEVREGLIRRAQRLTGDNRKRPMSRPDITEEDPMIFTQEWFELWEKNFSD